MDIAARLPNKTLLELFLQKADELGISPPALAPLMVTAARSCSLEAVTVLCTRDGIGATDFRGMTALMYACWLSQSSMVALLLQHGADPQKRGPDGWTPMMYALAVTPGTGSETGHAKRVREIITMLKNAGAQTDQTDDHQHDLRAIAHLAGSQGYVQWLDLEPESP